MNNLEEERKAWEKNLKEIRADFITTEDSIPKLELMHEYGVKIMQYLAIEIADRKKQLRNSSDDFERL